MKRKMIGICTVISIMIFSAIAIAAEKVEINDALKKGLISVTVYGKANGEMAQLIVKRLSTEPVIITFKEGRTDIAGEISVLVKNNTEIDLSSKYEEVIFLKQTGANRLTKGPVTINPKSSK
jgi:hypothetical protein